MHPVRRIGEGPAWRQDLFLLFEGDGMRQVWITFRSLTHAQRAKTTLERKGITASLTRAPKELSLRGCAYAVVLRKKIGEAARLIEELKLPAARFFERSESGEYREVQL